jgi:hypothetical protein
MIDYTIRRRVASGVFAAILISGMGEALFASDATRSDKPIMAPK